MCNRFSFREPLRPRDRRRWKLGLSSATGARSRPQGVVELVPEAEEPASTRCSPRRRGARDAFTPLAWWGRETIAHPARHVDRADLRPHAHVVRHARAHARPPLGRAGRARPGRVRPAGGGGLVRPAVRQAAGPHPRVRRHHPPGAGPRGAGDQRRTALPAALRRRRRRRPRQAAQADRAPAARRRADLARRRGPEERRADRRDRRRLDPDLLLAASRRACTSRGSTRASPGRAPGVPAPTSRSPRPATSRSYRRRRGDGALDAIKPVARALHGRHGRQGAELPQAGLRPDGLRRPRRRGAGAVPRRRKDEATALIPDELVDDDAHRRRPRPRSGARRGVGGRPA